MPNLRTRPSAIDPSGRLLVDIFAGAAIGGVVLTGLCAGVEHIVQADPTGVLPAAALIGGVAGGLGGYCCNLGRNAMFGR